MSHCESRPPPLKFEDIIKLNCRIRILCMILLGQAALVGAHEPDEAYFEFRQDGNELVVQAEFSWTLRLALLQASPNLEKSRTQEAFDTALFDYFSNHIVAAQQDNALQLRKIEPLVGSDSHSAVYQLRYGPLNLFHRLRITNTCLFELYDDPKNYATIFLPGEEKVTVVTTKHHADFMLPTQSAARGNVWIIAIVLCGLAVGYTIRKVEIPRRQSREDS